MSPWRIGLIAGGSAFMAAWITAATTSRQPALMESGRVVATEPRSAASVPAVLGLADEVGRLRKRLESTPVPQESVRNPFAMGVREPAMPSPAAATVAGRVDAARVVDAVPRAAEPTAVLIGLAEHDGAATAIVTLPTGDVVFVEPGQILPDGFRAEMIDDTGVRLVGPDGSSHRLTLP